MTKRPERAAFPTGRPRRVSLNESFFDTWSHDMAWALGFFVADGCVCITNPARQPKVGFYNTNIELIVRVKEVLQSGHKISCSLRSSRKPLYSLNIGSLRYAEALRGLGVGPRKSTRGVNVDVPLVFQPDFAQGYFDGDGSASVTGPGSARLSFHSKTLGVLESIRSWLLPLGVATRQPWKDETVYRLRYAKRKDVILIRDWMCQRPPVLLRKYQVLRVVNPPATGG